MWGLKAIDVKAAQPERPLVGYRDWGTSVVFLDIVWFKIFKASVSPLFLAKTRNLSFPEGNL